MAKENTEDRMEEYVEFTAPYNADVTDMTPLFLQVNGENTLIRRGETVSIKRKFVEAFRCAQAQERAAIRYQLELQRAMKSGPMADL